MPIISKENEHCWQSVEVLKDTKFTNNSTMARDFNLVLSNSEKRGESIMRDPFCESMEDFIADWDLIDIKPLNNKYTWSKI